MKQFLTTVMLVMLAVTAAAQGTVKGVVVDESNGEAVPFATVMLENTSNGTITDLNGFFLINKLKAGDYSVRVHCIGYEEHRETVTINERRSVNITVKLKPMSQTIKTVEVTSTRSEERKMQTQVSVEKLTASQIQQMPSVGGTADIAQYMQVLPGVNSTGDQGGQLYVRGGSMIQNLTLLDGMVVYNPFHSIGLYSIFETDIILNADIYTGGFGAEYGGRLSSVMDIKTRDGNKRRHSGKLGINTFGASILLEGPLKRETDNSRSAITYLLSAKNSYLSHTSKILYPYVSGGMPFDFTDLYGKLTINSGTGSKASLFGFVFDDSVSNFQSIANYHWRNIGFGTNFMLVTGSSAILEGTLAYSNYRIGLDDGSTQDKFSTIGGFNATLQATNFIGDNRLSYGLSMEGYTTDYQFWNQYSKHISQHEPSTNLSVYMTYKAIAGKWLLEPGVRLIDYASLRSLRPEPRISAKYNATDRLRFKAAAGLYSQVFLDARSDNDVVNLFTGFLTGSADLGVPSSFLGSEVTTCVQQARHLIVGAEYDITKLVSLNAELYVKHFNQLLNANRNKMYDTDEDPAYGMGGVFEKPEYLTKNYIIEDGIATGLDISLTADLDRLYLWATYSLGYVQRTDEVLTYNPHYDRRHTVNVLATYTFGKENCWEISGRWTIGSGFPFTQTQGVYQMLGFDGNITGDYTRENGDYSIHYAELYKGRLPAYHRLDIGLKRKISMGARSVLELNLGATNVYSRKNIFYFNRATFERVNQLPLMVTFGLNFRF
ncbi:MAG: TonB-dependent receptor [Bacteroidales bacterium]|nr:TonB-dependent receptor [Bacteroidales bacterium]